MAKYIKQEMTDLDGSGKQRVYYRMKTQGTLSGRDFIRKVAYTGSGLSEGNVMHVLAIVAKELAYYMGQGYTVGIDGVGTFKPTIGLVEDKEMDDFDSAEAKRNARSLMVNGVSFRAAKELIQETAHHCDLEKGGTSRLRRSPYTRDERLELARNYLREHHVMRIADYMEITSLSRTRATVELQEFSSSPDSGITCRGRGSAKVYCLDTAPSLGH